jgi:hypothetical protein
MEIVNIIAIIIVFICCIYGVGSLFYIQKKIGEFASCPRGLTPLSLPSST